MTRSTVRVYFTVLRWPRAEVLLQFLRALETNIYDPFLRGKTGLFIYETGLARRARVLSPQASQYVRRATHWPTAARSISGACYQHCASKPRVAPRLIVRLLVCVEQSITAALGNLLPRSACGSRLADRASHRQEPGSGIIGLSAGGSDWRPVGLDHLCL